MLGNLHHRAHHGMWFLIKCGVGICLLIAIWHFISSNGRTHPKPTADASAVVVQTVTETAPALTPTAPVATATAAAPAPGDAAVDAAYAAAVAARKTCLSPFAYDIDAANNGANIGYPANAPAVIAKAFAQAAKRIPGLKAVRTDGVETPITFRWSAAGFGPSGDLGTAWTGKDFLTVSIPDEDALSAGRVPADLVDALRTAVTASCPVPDRAKIAASLAEAQPTPEAPVVTDPGPLGVPGTSGQPVSPGNPRNHADPHAASASSGHSPLAWILIVLLVAVVGSVLIFGDKAVQLARAARQAAKARVKRSHDSELESDDSESDGDAR